MTVDVAPGLLRLLIALLVGILIGLERERAANRKSRAEFAGVRTFPLIALAGCIPMLLQPPAGYILLAISFLATAAVTLIFYRAESAAGEVGATTEIAAIATFLLGALAGAGGLLFAGATGIVVAVLLVSKPPLEEFSNAITPEEIAAVLQLAVISVIVLPVLPNEGYGPWAILNPRSIWLVVVLVSGISLAAFVAVRLLGERRGLLVTGAIGSLVSSTAVTVAMADRSRENPASAPAAAAAAVVASTVMAIRVAVLAAVINVSLLPVLWPPIAAMTVVGAIASILLIRHKDGGRPSPTAVRNPFRLRQAITFALIYAAILLTVRAAREYLAPAAIYAVAALSAVVDVDAVTIAFAQQGPGSDGWRTVAAAVTVAAVVNTLVKLGIAAARGDAGFGRRTGAALGSMAAAGIVTGLAVFFL